LHVEIESLRAAASTASPPASTGARGEWTIDAFVASLGMSRCVSEALYHGRGQEGSERDNESELALMKAFTSREAIQQRLADGSLVDRIADLLWEGVEKLKAAAADTGALLNAKVHAEPAPCLTRPHAPTRSDAA
jgi:hypothetical protein